MSYTQFICAATCKVVDSFNVESYLDGLSVRCVEKENSIFEFYGLDSNDNLDVNFNDYVRKIDNKIFIECDTEEINSNTEVWDWLIDQFIPIMISDLMEIKSVSIDSREGIDLSISYLDKNNKCINSDELIENYLKS